MADILIYFWLGLSALIGYGAAFFFAFFALDTPMRKCLELVVYIIAWFVIGTALSICAALVIPFLLLFSSIVFILEIIQKERTH